MIVIPQIHHDQVIPFLSLIRLDAQRYKTIVALFQSPVCAAKYSKRKKESNNIIVVLSGGNGSGKADTSTGIKSDKSIDVFYCIYKVK